MGVDELLRRYLRQRRELGEREIVLGALRADEVLRALRAATPSAAPRDGAPASGAQHGARAPTRETGASDPRFDWRSVLQSVEAATTEGKPAQRTPAVTPTPAGAARASRPVAEPAPTAPLPPSGLVVGGSTAELFGGPISQLGTLDEIAQAVGACTRCPLYSTAMNPVPGEGSAVARLMCIGEAPGAVEDETGRPFVGQAGQLLTKILAAIDLRREDVFIANVLKHRPPGNRNPRPEEVDACRPYLGRQIEVLRPRVIIAFGTFAAQTLLETKLPIGRLRGAVHRYHGTPVIVTYHPAALLRNPAWKKPTWEDVQLARRLLDTPAA